MSHETRQKKACCLRFARSWTCECSGKCVETITAGRTKAETGKNSRRFSGIYLCAARACHGTLLRLWRKQAPCDGVARSIQNREWGRGMSGHRKKLSVAVLLATVAGTATAQTG